MLRLTATALATRSLAAAGIRGTHFSFTRPLAAQLATAAAPAPAPTPTPTPRPVPRARFTPPSAAGPGGSPGTTLRAALVSAGVLAEPYRGEPPPLPLTAWVTPSGWKARWGRWLGGAKSMYTLVTDLCGWRVCDFRRGGRCIDRKTLFPHPHTQTAPPHTQAKCRKLIPGWELATFKRDVVVLHASVNAALASADRSALRTLLTPSEYAAAKRQVAARVDAGWASVKWEVARPIEPGRDVELVHARLVMANPRDERAGFAQITARVRCDVAFEAKDRAGKVVAGGDRAGGVHGVKTQSIQDVWVFERYLGGGPAARWRVAARLDVPPVARRRRGGVLGWLAWRRAG